LVQTSGCLKALRELQQSKRLQLPEARENAVHRELRRLDSPLEEPDDLPASVEEIRELELIRVETESEVRVWNELMRPKTSARSGAVGRAQIRYLIRSEHGWLGGLAFSASALQRKDRDEWIGWNRDTRRQHLHRVINLSRFLIRSFLRCANRQPRGY
ncbi:MAG: Druantia anti-phage system protein DruA, partial [Methylococcales bacterium]